MNFTQYANKTLENLPNTKSAYLYKQQVIAEMTKRANELIESGLKDNKVINELIISEFSDIEKDFYVQQEKQQNKNKKQKIGQMSVLGVLGYILAIVVAYLSFSFVSGAWSKTWLLLVAGILLPVAAGMLVSATKLNGKKTLYTAASRVMLVGSIFIVATVVFLVSIIFTDIKNTWLIFILAVAFSLLADGLMASKAKQKSAVVSWLLYIPVIAAMVYVFLGITVSFWHPGWLIIVIAVLADIFILMKKINNKADKAQEEMNRPWEKE